MILVVMGDEYIVNGIGQVHIREMVHRGAIAIVTDQRVYQDADVFCFYQNTGMKIVAPCCFESFCNWFANSLSMWKAFIEPLLLWTAGLV